MSVLAGKKGIHRKREAIFIFIALVGLIVLALMMASPAAAQDPEINVNIDQESQKADFTVQSDNSITISLTGNFTIKTESALPIAVYFGIHAPESWDTSISPDETTVPRGTTIVPFEGEVTIPKEDSAQEDYDVYVWASAESRNYGDIDWSSSTSSYRAASIIEVIKNRVKLIVEDIEQRALPNSTISYAFTVTNVATVTDTFFIDLEDDQEWIDKGWVITPSAEDLVLGPGESHDFQVDVQVPSNAPDGEDCEFEVFVSSSGHPGSSYSQLLTTKVRLPKTYEPFPWYFGLILIVAFVGTGIGLSAFFAATEVGYLALMSLFLPLYVRLKRKDVLSHFTRGQIFGYIQANPGAHYNAIIQHLGLQNGVGAYHLKVLEREGFIKSLRDGIYKRFYPMGVRVSERRLHLSRIQRDVLMEIQKHPGITQKQISKLLDESKQVVNYHVKILESAALIRLERKGRETACFAGKVKYVPNEDVYEVKDERDAAHIVHI